MQIVADQRPCSRARAADELVEQLDREEDENGAAGAAYEATELRAGACHDGRILDAKRWQRKAHSQSRYGRVP
jgi:hypothetical protein